VELESIASRLGRTTVELEHISKSYGDKVLIKDFTYIFLKSDRVGIIGPNGSGKSTLMKMIAGWVQPDAGDIRIGQTVKLGYFSQENEAMDESLKVIDYIREAAEYVKTKDGSISASQMLERFLFPSSMQYTVIGRLSGGEKRRLYLLRILMEAPNVLILDEPTNDLDIQTLIILEDYLDTFPGIVITVSHDRYFLDRVVTRIFAFEGQGAVTQYEGGFTDYQRALALKEERNGGAPETPQPENRAQEMNRSNWKETAGGAKKLKLSYKEQREWETIEDDIAGLEASVEALEQEMAGAASNYTRLNELMKEKEEKEKQLEEKMERWMYLNDLVEKIQAQK
jgi:ATP-binding cassette subfamily F protein uup